MTLDLRAPKALGRAFLLHFYPAALNRLLDSKITGVGRWGWKGTPTTHSPALTAWGVGVGGVFKTSLCACATWAPPLPCRLRKPLQILAPLGLGQGTSSGLRPGPRMAWRFAESHVLVVEAEARRLGMLSDLAGPHNAWVWPGPRPAKVGGGIRVAAPWSGGRCI